MTEIIQSDLEHSELGDELQFEIYEGRLENYEISVGNTEDVSYEHPRKIITMLEYLDAKGEEFSSASEEAVQLYLELTTSPDASPEDSKQAYEQMVGSLDKIRADLLFDATKMPWHKQRGSALALQTIVDAHDLIARDGPAAGEGIYPTMGGRLTFNSEEFSFGDNDGSVSNLNLRDAIIQSRQRFRGESEITAYDETDELLHKLDAFLQAPVTQDFKDIVAYCYDSLGIRSRKQEVSRAILDHVDQVIEQDPDKTSLLLLSVGCGTAQSILEVAADIRKKGVEPHIILLDQDPIGLAAAKNLAEQMGLEDAIEIHCERLFDKNGYPFDMTQILKDRKIDVAEDTGLREYLPDKIYRNLTQVVWDNLTPDGIMATGNMNQHRKQPKFLHDLMGWQPHVIKRTIAKGFSLHERSGIPKGSTKARVTRDGVYTLFFSYK